MEVLSMLQLMRRLIDAKRRDDGASAVEYGLLIAAIAALIVIVVFAFGGLVRDVFRETCKEIDTKTAVSASAPSC
jgi:pilus assembly protein Flp/PilA